MTTNLPGWPVEDIEELRERLINSHISAFIAGERQARAVAIEDRQYIKAACVDAVQLIDVLLAAEKGELP